MRKPTTIFFFIIDFKDFLWEINLAKIRNNLFKSLQESFRIKLNRFMYITIDYQRNHVIKFKIFNILYYESIVSPYFFREYT